jgi:N-acyl homoserine lactone hydrolase
MTMPKRLYLMQLSTTDVPLGGGRVLPMVNVCYLIETDDGQYILIDSGMPLDHQPPDGMPYPENQKNVLEHLDELGLNPDDIDLFISTHFDIDHAGNDDLFPNAEHIIQREHYELARSGHPRYTLARYHWDSPTLNYRLVDGDTELMSGLTLLKTSGHAPAHQSVLVHLPKTGTVLLAIDAVILERLFTVERKATPTDDNEEQLRASTQKLLDVVEQEQARLVVFGHDGLQWQTLKKAPEYYE